MAAFYADENFRYPVVAALRLLGHDVLTCQEAGRADHRLAPAVEKVFLTPFPPPT
jgi:hypothetical protein